MPLVSRIVFNLKLSIVIFSKTGYPVFFHPFTTDSVFDEKVVGNFISISGQLGTESLDRLKFGEFTVLLNQVDLFSISYIF